MVNIDEDVAGKKYVENTIDKLQIVLLLEFFIYEILAQLLGHSNSFLFLNFMFIDIFL